VPSAPWPLGAAEERGDGGEGEVGFAASYMPSSGASKKASRYVEFAVRTSKRAFPVPTTVMGRRCRVAFSTKVSQPRSRRGWSWDWTAAQVERLSVLISMRSVRDCVGSVSKTPFKPVEPLLNWVSGFLSERILTSGSM